MRVSVCLAAVAMVAIAGALSPALSRSSKPRHHARAVAVAPPSEDAFQLGFLAPPTRLTTLRQDYGDAAFARSRANARYPGELAADRRLEARDGAPYPCDPRRAASDSYVCRGGQRAPGYGQSYAFTPAYVSSPQVVGETPHLQDEVLPPVTAILWAVDGLGSHD